MTLHYEIEVPEHDPDFVGAWRPVRVFRHDLIPMPLTFESLNEALDFVARAAGEARVVRVTDEGDREMVGPDEA